MENKKNTDLDFDFEEDEFIQSYARKEFMKNLKVFDFTDEEELIELTMNKTIIIHFYDSSFSKCNFMSKALGIMAIKFPQIKFMSIKVQNCPKMCKSLGITTLPYLGFFKDGYFIDNLIGFEKLGNKGYFEIDDLENYIKNSKILKNIEN